MKIGPVPVPRSAQHPYGNDQQEAGGHNDVKRFFNELPGDAMAAPQAGPLDMTKIIPATSQGE